MFVETASGRFSDGCLKSEFATNQRFGHPLENARSLFPAVNFFEVV